MKKALVLLAALLPLAAGPALAKNDKAGMDRAAKTVGEPRQPKAGRGGDDATKGMSFDHRRDGRGEADNPGGGKAKGRNKAGKNNQ